MVKSVAQKLSVSLMMHFLDKIAYLFTLALRSESFNTKSNISSH